MDYDGLTTRLLAAIEETERIAQAAIRWSEGASEWADGENPDWVHIARHDPATELIRCEADREIVELHSPVHVPPTWVMHGLMRLMETTGGVFCKTCCAAADGTSYPPRIDLEWPCPTLLAMAKGYDLIPTEVPDGHHDH